MPPPDWDRIKQVFTLVASVPLAARDGCLESACGGDQDLRSAVEELLDAHGAASQSFLEPGSIVLAASWLFREGAHVAGRFTVIRRIARGAMGEVYQVFDERLQLPVALKAIRPELLGNSESVERFSREVRVTRGIAHEGLCRVFDLVEHSVPPQSGFPEGTVVPCLTMELLEGETLEEWLQTRRPLPLKDALPLLRQVAEALQVLHDADIVHRDLKPSNVMLVPAAQGMRAVLTDFGLAKPIAESVFETQAAVQGGAPFFMAPELFRGDRPSRASDVYAFGLLIDEMVTTERAFSGETLHGLLLAKLGEGPKPPSARSKDLPKAWDRAIMRCLASDPVERFDSALAIVDALTGKRPLWSAPWMRRLLRRINPMRPYPAAAYGTALAVALTGASLSGPIQEPAGVAVLPFRNLTDTRELGYLATGTAVELSRRLVQVPTVRVYSMADPNVSVPRGVTYAIDGHIQEAAGTLRVTVQLTDASTRTVLWAQRFEGPMAEALQLEDRLAVETARELERRHASASGGFVNRLVNRIAGWVRRGSSAPSSGTTSNAAFDDYMRGRTLFEERTIPSALQAIGYLKRAVVADPNYAPVYATLADLQWVLADLGYAPYSGLIKEAEQYMDRAVALGPNLPDVQLSLAALRQMQWRWDEAETAYKRAIELHPTSARAHRWYGGLLLQFGRFEESLEKHRHALELDPSDFPSQSALGQVFYMSGRPLEAAAHLEQLLARKDLLYAHAQLGQVYAYLIAVEPGQRDAYLQKALARARMIREKDGSIDPQGVQIKQSIYGDLIAALAWSYAGNPLEAAPFFQRLKVGRAEGHVTSAMLARVYLAQGDATHAMDELLEAEVHHERDLYYIRVSPAYRLLRDEPQFRALVDRLGLSR
jgi:serine/threonine-protein kinase